MTVDHYISTRLRDMKGVSDSIAFKFRMDKDDHLQNCLINAIRLQDSYIHESDRKFFNWWGMLCYNQAINVYRKNKKEPPMVDAERAAQVPGTGNRIDDRNALAHIYWKIRRHFGPRNGTRYSIIMYMVSQQYKYEEIAEEMNMPIGTVRGVIHRCRLLLTQNPTNMAENAESNSDNRVTSEFTEVIAGVSKKCRGKCGNIKGVEMFSKNKLNKDGLQDICKSCTSDFMRDYNARKNMERKQAQGLTAGNLSLDTSETIPRKIVKAVINPVVKPVVKSVVKQKEFERTPPPPLAPRVVDKSTPATRNVKLPDSKKAEFAEIKSETKKVQEEVVKIQLSAEEKAVIMSSLDRHIHIVEGIIEKLSR